MNQHLSDVGVVVSIVRTNTARKTAGEWQRLRGWTLATEMPSMDDVQRAYKGLAELCGGGEMLFISEVAASMPEYRGTCTFVHDGTPYFGIEFFYRGGSLFLAFCCDEEKTACLYYMGMSERLINPREKILHRCSRFSMVFSARLEEAYFDLRDDSVGKHGIPEAAH